jgi:hypothetical protein
MLSTPKRLGLGLSYFIDELGEAVRNRLRSGLVIVLSQPPPDLGANLVP